MTAPPVCKQLSRPSGSAVLLFLQKHVFKHRAKKSRLPQSDENRRKARPQARLGASGGDRPPGQTDTAACPGRKCSLFWQNVGFEGHRDSPRWAEIPPIRHSSRTPSGGNPPVRWLAGYICKRACRKTAPVLAVSGELIRAGQEFQPWRKGNENPKLRKPGKPFLERDLESMYSPSSVNNSISGCLSQGGVWIYSSRAVRPELGSIRPATPVLGVSHFLIQPGIDLGKQGCKLLGGSFVYKVRGKKKTFSELRSYAY